MSIDFSGAASRSSRTTNAGNYYALLSKVEGKANRVTGNVDGNIAVLSGRGDLEDGGVSGKKLLVEPDAFNRGNIPMFGETNKLLDSGIHIYSIKKWNILHNDTYYTQTNLLSLASTFKEYLLGATSDNLRNVKLSLLQDAIDKALKLREYLSNPESLFVSQLPISIDLHNILILTINMCNSLEEISQLKSTASSKALQVPDTQTGRCIDIIDLIENLEMAKKITDEQLLKLRKQKLILSLGLSPLQLDYNFLNTILYASDK